MQRVLSLWAVCVGAAVALTPVKAWHWWPEDVVARGMPYFPDYMLTANNGDHAVALREYVQSGDTMVWVTIAATRDESEDAGFITVFEWKDLFLRSDRCSTTVMLLSEAANATVEMSDIRKHIGYVREDEENFYTCHRSDNLTATGNPWYYWFEPDSWPLDGLDGHVGLVAYRLPEIQGGNRMLTMVGANWPGGEPANLICWTSHDDGATFTWDALVANGNYFDFISLGANPKESGWDLHLAYHVLCSGIDSVVYRKSTDAGGNWSDPPVGLSVNGDEPCLASLGDTVLVCWTEGIGTKYRWSTDGGARWSATKPVPGYADVHYAAPNATLKHYGGRCELLLLRELQTPGQDPYSQVEARYGYWHAGMEDWLWSLDARWLLYDPPNGLLDDYLNPSVASYVPANNAVPMAAVAAWSDPRNQTELGRELYRRVGQFWLTYSRPLPPWETDEVGRRLLLDGTGRAVHTCVAAGDVLGGRMYGCMPTPIPISPGERPALAVDGISALWIPYVRDDTVWCKMGANGVKQVFAGSNAARPGQPSIACYPNKVNGVYAGACVFPVYDSAGGTSSIMFAKVCTTAVILDTVDVSSDQSDSSPCINIYDGDKLWVTWQRGDSVVSDHIQYPATGVTQPPAWESMEEIAEVGYHPMSVLENSVLTCVWSEFVDADYDTFHVRKRVRDLASSTMGWATVSTPSEQNTVERCNPVFGGVGVSAWQEKVNNKWAIRGQVRTDTVTFVANDTDAYHPHVVVCSSAVSPSIDQVRVHLLYTAGVVFEVDSAVYDTGQARYVCCSLNVSHAGANATEVNAGSKLMRVPSKDSLVCVYRDASQNVVYAVSAAGDSWKRATAVSSRDKPAVCQDSSGRRYLLVYADNGRKIEARYRCGGDTWSTAQTVYELPNGVDLYGPIAVAGSGAGTQAATPCAYCAFTVHNNEAQANYLIVGKFDGGSNVALDTVATGTDQIRVYDATIACENVSGSDNVHVAHRRDMEVRYTMSDGAIDPADWGQDLTWAWETEVNLSNTEGVSAHPYVACDLDRVAIAWEEGNDIMARQRSTDSSYATWEDTCRLVCTQGMSSWPTVSVGDSIVVAWQESRSEADIDIMASVEFGDTFVVQNTSTKSSYPHVVFQNKASGDTMIPYIHVVWSEEPSEAYFEVEYQKLSLKQVGGGQQSQEVVQLLEPRLFACAPNPFTGRTSIAYQFGRAGNVHLRLYDVNGRLVKTFINCQQNPGRYSVTWDGRDNRGRSVAKGVYFYRLDAPGIGQTKKAVMAR